MAAKTWMGWSLAVAAVVAAGPLVLGRGNPALSTSLEEISRMSDVERAALQRKYEQYLSKSEAERAALRALHQEIENDRTNGARALSTMHDYCDWLKTIDAWQQDELVHLTDPQQKARRVAEIVAERRSRAMTANVGPEERQIVGNGPPQLPQLNEAQLTKIFNVLARRLSLSDEEQKQLDSLKGLKRFGVQIRHLKKSITNPEAFFLSISDAELSEMVTASGNAELAALWSSGRGDQNIRKRFVIFIVLESCQAQFMREASQATDSELQAYFGTLPPETQDQLLQLGADEFKTQVKLRRMESDPDAAELESLLGNRFSTARRRLERFRGDGGFRGPNGPGGPPYDRRRDDAPGRPQRPFRDGGFRNGGPPPGEDGGPPPEGRDEGRPPQPPPQ